MKTNLGLLIGKVKAGFPTTLSKNIEELRGVEPRHPHAYNQNMQGNNPRWILLQLGFLLVLRLYVLFKLNLIRKNEIGKTLLSKINETEVSLRTAVFFSLWIYLVICVAWNIFRLHQYANFITGSY